jgi:hypothetical protein
MDEDTLKRNLGRMGELYRNMTPGPACPPEDMLFDYVYDDLSEEEKRDVSEHVESCERCRFEVMKLEADRVGWEHALNKDPDAALAQALGSAGIEQVRGKITEWKAAVSKSPKDGEASIPRPRKDFPKLDPDLLERIAAAAAAEVLENVDLHIAYWKKTRGKQPHYGMDTGLARATGLGGDILPVIAEAVSRAWEWCAGKQYDLAAGVLGSALAVYVSSIFQERKGLTGLVDKEIDVLVSVIAQQIVESISKEMGSAADE